MRGPQTASLLIFCACLLPIYDASFILFNAYFYSRDHAQYCCEKYGMSLMKLDSKFTNDFVESFLRTVPGVTEIWLGLFYNTTASPSQRVTWADRHIPQWTNFNNETSDLIDQMNNQTANETLCIKAVLSPGSGMQWSNASCDSLLTYGCHVGLNRSAIPLTVTNAECPKLVKLTGRQIVRNGSPVSGGALNHGLFDIHDKIYDMGTQVSSKIVKYVSDCALHCIANTQCTDAIIVSEMLCILYKN